MEATVRQQIIEKLKARPHTAFELSQMLRVSQRDIENHLKYVEKSAKTQMMKFKIESSMCENCKFDFEDRSRKTKPSRCPKCKCERITPPMFSIEEK